MEVAFMEWSGKEASLPLPHYLLSGLCGNVCIRPMAMKETTYCIAMIRSCSLFLELPPSTALCHSHKQYNYSYQEHASGDSPGTRL